MIPMRDILKNFWRRAGIVVKLLVLLSIVVTLATEFGDENNTLAAYLDFSRTPSVPQEILNGELHRLVTPIFVHFLWLHIIFNMMWLYDLGGAIELRNGKSAIICLVLAIAILSNTAEFFSGTYGRFGGMSGVVYGLFGYIWIRSLDKTSGFFMPRNIVIILLGWQLLCFTGIFENIANVAHVSGLLVGIVWAAVLKDWPRRLLK